MKGVEIERDLIVVGNGFARHEVGPHFTRLVATDECRVQVRVVVREIRRRLLADWTPVSRLALTEVAHTLRGEPGVWRDEIVDGRPYRYPGDAHGGLRRSDAQVLRLRRGVRQDDTEGRQWRADQRHGVVACGD